MTVPPSQLLVTGAAGGLATDIIPGLAAAGFVVAGTDRVEPAAGVRAVLTDFTLGELSDEDRLVAALAGADAVIHLGGIPLEDDWDRLVESNISGTYHLLEAARRAGTNRVILASSIHAAGFVPRPGPGEEPVPDEVGFRPNTRYGVTKVAVEALGSMYHDRYGMDVLAARIASRCAEPVDERMLSTWLSPADAVRFFGAALRCDPLGFRVVWAVSANERRILSAGGGTALGYSPVDNAEEFASSVARRVNADPSPLAAAWDLTTLGGVFSSPEPPAMPGYVTEEPTRT